MKVILKEKVKSLGSVGDIVNVSAGFARNFLIPGNKAILADESNQKQLLHHQRVLAKRVEEEKNEALEVQKKLKGKTLTFIKRSGANGKLFGTVTGTEISDVLGKEGLDVEKRVLVISTPIKTLGTFEVKAKLFKGVEASFTVDVKIDPKQAEELKKKAEEAALKKAEAKAAEKEAKEANGEGEGEEKKELTEEQKLQAEADTLLRS